MKTISRHIDLVFNRAPVMMHSVDREGRLVKVNRRWLRTLGYRKDEVLGRKSIEFLTEASRVCVMRDALPLFWRAGSARSIGIQFLRRNGRVLDTLLDADVSTGVDGSSVTYAAIRKGHDLDQYEQASTTLVTLQQLMRVRLYLESVQSSRTIAALERPDAAIRPALGDGLDVRLAEDLLGPLLELAKDISLNLRGLLRAQEESLGDTAEQQRELLTIARSIDRSLADMADSLVEVPPGPR